MPDVLDFISQNYGGAPPQQPEPLATPPLTTFTDGVQPSTQTPAAEEPSPPDVLDFISQNYAPSELAPAPTAFDVGRGLPLTEDQPLTGSLSALPMGEVERQTQNQAFGQMTPAQEAQARFGTERQLGVGESLEPSPMGAIDKIVQEAALGTEQIPYLGDLARGSASGALQAAQALNVFGALFGTQERRADAIDKLATIRAAQKQMGTSEPMEKFQQTIKGEPTLQQQLEAFYTPEEEARVRKERGITEPIKPAPTMFQEKLAEAKRVPGAFAENPRVIPELVGQAGTAYAATGMGPAMGLGAAGKLVGRPMLGAAFGGGTGEGLLDFSLEFIDSLERDSGVDTSDAGQLQAAIQDPEIRRKAEEIAGKHALGVGTIGGLSQFHAGRIFKPEMAASRVGKAARTGAEAAFFQGPLEAAAEAAGQLASRGEADITEIAAEYGGGVGKGVQETAVAGVLRPKPVLPDRKPYIKPAAVPVSPYEPHRPIPDQPPPAGPTDISGLGIHLKPEGGGIDATQEARESIEPGGAEGIGVEGELSPGGQPSAFDKASARSEEGKGAAAETPEEGRQVGRPEAEAGAELRFGETPEIETGFRANEREAMERLAERGEDITLESVEAEINAIEEGEPHATTTETKEGREQEAAPGSSQPSDFEGVQGGQAEEPGRSDRDVPRGAFEEGQARREEVEGAAAETPEEGGQVGGPEAEAGKVVRQPWEMTKEEFREEKDKHISLITQWLDALDKENEATDIARGGALPDRTGVFFSPEKIKEIRQNMEDRLPALATSEEFLDHESHVKKALAEGKPVPPEVLAQYPDLQGEPHATTTETKEGQARREEVEGVVYHGSPEGELKVVDTLFTTGNWREGIGFYTTESLEVAKSYAQGRTARGERRKSAEKKGRVNRVKIAPDARFLDMDAPVDTSLWDAIAKSLGVTYDASIEGAPFSANTNGSAYQDLVNQYAEENRTSGTEAAYSIRESLDAIYDGTTHIEGKKKSPHRVRILFNPDKVTILPVQEEGAVEEVGAKHAQETAQEEPSKQAVTTQTIKTERPADTRGPYPVQPDIFDEIKKESEYGPRVSGKEAEQVKQIEPAQEREARSQEAIKEFEKGGVEALGTPARRREGTSERVEYEQGWLRRVSESAGIPNAARLLPFVKSSGQYAGAVIGAEAEQFAPYQAKKKTTAKRIKDAETRTHADWRKGVETIRREAKGAFTSPMRHLPKGEEYDLAIEKLTQYEAAPGVNNFKILRNLTRLTKPLGKVTDGINIFRHKIIFDDLYESLGKAFKFDTVPKSIKQELGRIEKIVRGDPILKQTIADRHAYWAGVADRSAKMLKRHGYSSEDVYTRLYYFRNNVFALTDTKQSKRVGGSGAKTKRGAFQRASYRRHRTDNALDYLTDYYQAEGEILAQAETDTDRGNLIADILEHHNKYGEAKRKAESRNKELIGNHKEPTATWEDFIPEGHVIYDRGKILRRAQMGLFGEFTETQLRNQLKNAGISEDAIEAFFNAFNTGAEPAVIPRPLAETLDEIAAGTGKRNIIQKAFIPLEYGQTAWKFEVLYAPFKIIKYTARQLNDMQKTLAMNPKAFLRWHEAAADLWRVYVENKPPQNTDTLASIQRGSVEATFVIQELNKVGKSKAFRDITHQKMTEVAAHYAKNPHKALVDVVKNYFRATRSAQVFREVSLKLANHYVLADEMRASPDGLPTKGYRASLPHYIEAQESIDDRAHAMARDLVGPYETTSWGGKQAAKYVIPFWRFHEQLYRTWYRGLANAMRNDKVMARVGHDAAKAKGVDPSRLGRSRLVKIGMLLVGGLGPWAAMVGINRKFFREEDDDLDDDLDLQAKLIFGRNEDGEVVYFPRIDQVSEALSIVGMEDAPQDLVDYFSGKKTLPELLDENLKQGASHIINMVGPILKIPAELLYGKALFPDAFKARTIRDKAEYFWSSLGVGEEFRIITKHPKRKSGTELVRSMYSYSQEPNAVSYFRLLDEKRRFAKDVFGKVPVDISPTPKSQALYWFRYSLADGDWYNANNYLMEYYARNGTKKGLEQSREEAHPIRGGLNKKQEKVFRDYVFSDPDLTNDYVKAERHWNKVWAENLAELTKQMQENEEESE